jgi:hypothetical protein
MPGANAILPCNKTNKNREGLGLSLNCLERTVSDGSDHLEIMWSF